MSTNAFLSIESNNKILEASLNWDGYPSFVKPILLENYNTEEKVLELIEQGALSILAESCSKPRGHSWENPVKGFCVYYGRDRAESNMGVDSFEVDAYEEFSKDAEDYQYLFKNGEWLYKEKGGEVWTKLADVVITESN